MRDLAYQIRMPLRHPTDDEERGPALVARQQLEQAIHAADHPGLEAIPIGTTHARFERRHLEILFDVDAEVMADHARRGLQRACPAIRGTSNNRPSRATPHGVASTPRHTNPAPAVRGSHSQPPMAPAMR